MSADYALQGRQDCIIDEFANLGDGMAKYLHLIELGREAPSMEAVHRVQENLLGGCQAEVWMRGVVDEGVLRFEVDSDSLIVKGLAVLVARVLSGSPPSVVAEADLYFIDAIGLSEHLSPTRANGLHAMVKRMRAIAAGHAKDVEVAV